jgi:Na+/melibiose symporter-like transporter
MMIFGILFGSFAISGQVSLIMVVPNVLIAMAASAVARNKGLKWSYVTWLSIGTLCLITLGLLMWNGQPGMIDFSNLTLYAVMFIVFYICGRSFSAAPAGLILTMAADVSDYETSESGRYVSGMMGTIFSLTDSIASSLAPMSIGWVLAAVGHGGAYPDESTALTPNLRIAALVIMVGIPVVANLLALGFMKFYTLDKETMEGIQGKLSDMRRARNKEEAERIAETEQVVAE